MVVKKWLNPSLVLSIALLAIAVFTIARVLPAQAAATITVNSVADDQDNDGECTLREAIIASNTDAASGGAVGECAAGSGIDTIEFDIAGAGLHTIQPLFELPTITQTVTIDGYSEPGATANSAAHPLPMNGTLTVELDGINLTLDHGTWGLRLNASNSVVRGLIVNNFGNSGIIVDADDVVVQGNYIGTDATGLIDEGNGRGYAVNSIAHGVLTEVGANGTLIGGLDPEDRNVIAGNQAGDIMLNPDNGTALNHTTVQGNYIGVGANGTTPLPSGYGLGLGNAILMENTHYTLIGGTDTGAGNIIGSSKEYGVGFREGVTNTTVQGNRIGTDYTGTQVMTHSLGTGNAQAGIHVGAVSNVGFTLKSHDILIGGTTASARNIISGNNNGGSNYISGIRLDDGAYNVTVQGNYIGTTTSGLSTLPNGTGFLIDTTDPALYQQAYDNTIGGSAAGARNVIAGNIGSGIYLSGPGITNNTFSGNYIGLGADGNTTVANGEDGVRILEGPQNNMIGGDTAGEGNTIVASTGNGPNSEGAGIVAYGGTSKNSFLGNSIHTNAGLGIDLSPDGVTPNDTNDVDSGPNDLLNYPVYTQVDETGGDTVIDYRVGIPAGQYRVEFFSNASADPSGNGEGQTYLGHDDIVSAGPGLLAHTHTLVGVTGVTNLALTATKIEAGSPTGFGVTSEFGGVALPIVDVSVTKNLLNPNEVAKGAVVDYSLVITNDGPDVLDLTQYSSIGGPTLFIDFAPPDLVAANQLGPGLYPGTVAIDVGNPDVTCLWAGPGSGGLYTGLTTYADYSVMLCWYTGLPTELASGDSISTVISFTISDDSSLVFTNHALVASPDDDPDTAAVSGIYSSGDDVLELLIASGNTINNFASAPYPLPVEPGISVTPGPSSPLAAAGTNEAVWIVAGLGMLAAAAWLAVRLRKEGQRAV